MTSDKETEKRTSHFHSKQKKKNRHRLPEKEKKRPFIV